MATGHGNDLEAVTLRLVNLVAYTASTRANSRQLRDVTGIELPPADIRILEYLAGRLPLPLSQLAGEMRLDLAQASRQATSLEAAGYVVRQTDPADRRRTLVRLSDDTSELMDRWLLGWSSGYQAAVEDWPSDDVSQLTRWLTHVFGKLVNALPDRPVSKLPERWEQLVLDEDVDPVLHDFVSTLIALIAWVGQSGGFNDILELVGAPIRQHAYFTLRIVSRHGPMAISDVAERMGIDPSQASKRLAQLTQLGFVDRAVDAFDRRSNRVRVSRKGAALERRVHEWQLQSFTQLVGDLPDVNRRRWEALMHRFLDRLNATAFGGQAWAGTGEAVNR